MKANNPQLSDAHLIFLRDIVSKMHHRGEFCVINLRRKISKHCKTYLLGPRFGMRVKKSEFGLFCYIGETVDGITEIKVHPSRHTDKEFTIHVANNREFMDKLLKHDLL